MTSPTQVEKNPLTTQLELIDGHLWEGQPREAKALAVQFIEKNPENIDGWILLGRAYLGLMQFEKALDAGERAVVLDSTHPVARLLLIDGLLRCGRNKEALEAAKALEIERKYDPVVIFRIGNFYTRTNRHADAARCYERVRVLQPADHSVVYNLASAHIALGELDKAVSLFDGLLHKDAGEISAYYSRATLRKWSPERNHVNELENVLASIRSGDSAEPTLCYSLAKELEDLGEWKRAFAYLKRGADARRRSISYSVEVDLTMLDEVRRQFDESFVAESRPGYTNGRPIFVLGMPRSGTTLVDRIISSHSKVGSVGEAKEFGRAIGRGSRRETALEHVDIRQSRQLDPESLGREYCNAVNGLLPGYERLLDKTPRNFMYIGLILMALPNAKIIHVRRHAVDSCYAVYKTLFREGYSFSYDLSDIGRYYLVYLRLMDHWRRLLPGRFLDVDYEDLVDNQEDVSRRMVAFCGLDWEDACFSFEKNEAPSLTASAAQVRQPIYRSSVGLWRHYERELEPLIRILREGGIRIEGLE